MSEETQTRPDTGRLYQQHVQSILERSPEAWEGLLDLHGDRLRQDILISLRKRGLPDELSEDVEQESWLRALRNIENFVWEDDEKFYRWLRVISLKCIYELLRQRQNMLSISDLSMEETNPELEQFLAKHGLRDDGVEDMVVLRERMEAVKDALEILKTEEREIFIQWLMGERPRALAIIYQRKVGTISQLLQRASDKVRASLEAIQDRRESLREWKKERRLSGFSNE